MEDTLSNPFFLPNQNSSLKHNEQALAANKRRFKTLQKERREISQRRSSQRHQDNDGLTNPSEPSDAKQRHNFREYSANSSNRHGDGRQNRKRQSGEREVQRNRYRSSDQRLYEREHNRKYARPSNLKYDCKFNGTFTPSESQNQFSDEYGHRFESSLGLTDSNRRDTERGNHSEDADPRKQQRDDYHFGKQERSQKEYFREERRVNFREDVEDQSERTRSRKHSNYENLESRDSDGRQHRNRDFKNYEKSWQDFNFERNGNYEGGQRKSRKGERRSRSRKSKSPRREKRQRTEREYYEKREKRRSKKNGYKDTQNQENVVSNQQTKRHDRRSNRENQENHRKKGDIKGYNGEDNRAGQSKWILNIIISARHNKRNITFGLTLIENET